MVSKDDEEEVVLVSSREGMVSNEVGVEIGIAFVNIVVQVRSKRRIRGERWAMICVIFVDWCEKVNFYLS